MEGLIILVTLTLLVILIWFGSRFRYKILDAFSPVKSEYGVVVEKEYIPPHSKIVTKTVVRSFSGSDFGSTSYNIPAEVEIPEKCMFHINLNGKLLVTPVASKLYDSVTQGDRILVKYSQGRFSKKIYLKKIKR